MVTRGCRGLIGVTEGYNRLQELQRVSRSYRGLLRVARGYRVSEGVARAYRGL